MPMSEREMFLHSWEREFQTTVKVFKSMPEEKHGLQPHSKCPTTKDLAWKVAVEESIFVQGAISGQFDFANMPKPPASLREVIASYEQKHVGNVARITAMSDADFNKMIKFYVAPKTVGDVRAADVLWLMMMDTIHHRGQFSIYLRIADAKVPSIYGPSADEPWM